MRHLSKSGIVTLQALGGPIGSRTAPVQEGVSPKDMDKIKAAVEAATSFMNVGAHLKQAGLRYTFATSPMAIYIVQPTPNNKVAIVNKKYASQPDFVHGEIAVGIMESVNENTINEAEVGINVAWIYKKVNGDKNKFFNFLSQEKKQSKDKYEGMIDYMLNHYKENPKKFKSLKDKEEKLFNIVSSKQNESINESRINEIEYKDAVEKFNADLMKNSQVERIAKHHNKSVKDVVKALQPYLKVLKYNDKSVRVVSIDFRDTNSDVKVHASHTYNQNESVNESIENVANGLPQTMGKEKSLKRETLKNIVREVMQEEAEYQKFFQKVLDKAGKSIPSMSDEEKKAFFNKVDAAWKGKQEGK